MGCMYIVHYVCLKDSMCTCIQVLRYLSSCIGSDAFLVEEKCGVLNYYRVVTYVVVAADCLRLYKYRAFLCWPHTMRRIKTLY